MIHPVMTDNVMITICYTLLFSHTPTSMYLFFFLGQLFDSHGPSCTSKAHQSSHHPSKGHMTGTNTSNTTTNTHPTKGIDKEEVARKKLLLWRELKDKEMKAELKTQQLLLQKEKTERLRFLQEQQRKREQIKLWRDAEMRLKNEREVAERQARQVYIALSPES